MSEFVSKYGVNTDLVDYLISKGYQVIRHRQGYKIKVRQGENHSGDLSSLSIFPNRHGWKRWSNGTHGGDAIEFCRIVYGMTFQEAIQELGGSLIHVQDIQADMDIQGGLILPERYKGRFSRLYAYLIQARGIAPEIVNDLVRNDYIYQDVRNNVVFVGRDETKQIRFAFRHGTNTNIDFKRECPGSDKRFSFSVSGMNNASLYIFESAIDLLSAATLANLIKKDSAAWKQNSRISLSGTEDVALSYYLNVHQHVTDLHFWLDNDSAGRGASEFLCRKYAEQGFRVFNHCPNLNDMNDELRRYQRAI